MSCKEPRSFEHWGPLHWAGSFFLGAFWRMHGCALHAGGGGRFTMQTAVFPACLLPGGAGPIEWRPDCVCERVFCSWAKDLFPSAWGCFHYRSACARSFGSSCNFMSSAPLGSCQVWKHARGTLPWPASWQHVLFRLVSAFKSVNLP